MCVVNFMPHQKDAIYKLKNGNILCGGVGTGKSITALGYYYICECGGVVWGDGNLGPMLRPRDLYIITTARKRDTKEWDEECARFGLAAGNDESVKVTIDSWNNIEKYKDVTRAFFIFDEQRVVGWGKWSKTFVRLSRRNRWILLTATPGDTWTDYIPVFLANGFYENKTAFLRRHAVYNRFSKYPKIDRWLEVNLLESLRRKITVVMTFEKHTERIWDDIWVNYDVELYKTVAEDRWNPWDKEPIRDISAACYLMRRVVNENKERVHVVRNLAMAHKKSIIFYNFDYELALLREMFEKRKDEDDISVAEWNGHKHEALPSGAKWAYLVQYNAGAEGWNCIETNTVIFFSQNYSYKIMEQAAGRIDRLNTPFDVLHYYVIKSRAPIDRAIEKAIKGKKIFNERLFIALGGNEK